MSMGSGAVPIPDAATAVLTERYAGIPFLLPILVGLIAGILLDDFRAVPPTVSICGMLLSAIAAVCMPLCRWTQCLVVLAAVGLGALLYHNAYRRLPENHVARVIGAGSPIARLHGAIISDPIHAQRQTGPFQRWFHQTERTHFVLEAQSLDIGNGSQTARGKVAVYVKENTIRLVLGDTVDIFGRVYAPGPPDNPGSMDWGRYQRQRGLWAAMSVPHEECVRIVADVPTSGWRRLWHDARSRSMAIFVESGPGSDDGTLGLLAAMVLGRRNAVEPEINALFVKTGCVHYLAVSGSNLAMLGAFVWWISQTLGRTIRTSTVLAMLSTVLYLLLVDPLPPILRATIIALIFGCTQLLRRPRSLVHAMTVSAIVMQLFWPTVLFDVGFQLSFTGLLGLGLVAPALSRSRSLLRFHSDPTDIEQKLLIETTTPWARVRWRVRRGLIGLLHLSSGPWVAAAPLSLFYFGRLPLLGWLNSILALFMVWLITVLGFATILLGSLSPTLGGWLSHLLSGLTQLLRLEMELLAEWADYSIIWAPPGWLVLFYYLCLALFIAAAFGRCRRRWLGISVIALLAAIALCVAWPSRRDGLRMAVLSVGRGTAIVLEIPDGKTLLYDAGTSNPYDVGAHTVVPYLRFRSIGSLETVLLSHPNLDHFSGLPSVLEAIPCRSVVSNPFFANLADTNSIRGDEPAEILLADLAKRKLSLGSVSRGAEALPLGEAIIECLWPPDPPPFELNANDSSLVLRIRYGSRSILLCGDIEKKAQHWLTEHEDLRADIMVSPHHGSTRTSLPSFFQAVQPRILIESTDVIRMTNEAVPEARFLSTANHGAVILEITDGNVRTFAGGDEVEWQVAADP